ncbi:MAG: hypothetical protein CL877_01740 [Dehalococcoidales bacterium]|jgi:protein AroM|nr:hypothetical protein [Dehalococcoidales bacterium]MDP6137810.1 AroM family protein [Arenicellales bacterium]HJP11851.1 AroM family protein [Arenicellales bacterium]|tara:strand:+ start:2114 stop:2863 length:750 start_codon:yes stop_codon:yes gene_type:complete
MAEPTRKIGAITIGQAPRDDIMTVMTPHLPERLEVLQHGALDDLDGTAIAALRPDLSKEREEGDKAQHSGSSIEYDVLVSRMRDGSEAMMTHGGVVPLMQQKVDALEAADVELIVLLCGGDFPELHSNRIILHPGKLLRGAVESVAHGARLGIVMPSDVQVNAAQRDAAVRWGAHEVFVTHGSPYLPETDLDDEWQRVSADLAQHQVDLVFLNCMGMNEQMKSTIRQGTGKPVILLSSMLARTITELLH